MSDVLQTCWPPTLGVVVGAVLGYLAAGWPAKRRDRTVGEHLSEEDRGVIEAEFVTHATAVRAQVAEYADALAGSDQLLRARLRNIEEGRRPA